MKYHHHRIITDTNHDLLYCDVPKASCTTIKAVWMDLNKSKAKNLTTVHKTYTANAAHTLDEMLSLHFIRQPTWPSGYENFTKFTVVRHPMDRLVSAYNNVVYYRKGMADHNPDVVTHFEGKLNTSGLNPGSLTFNRFLQEVTNSKSKVYHNRHWNPVSEICSICHIRYDYLLKLERIFNDFQLVSKVLGHPHFKLSTYGVTNAGTMREEMKGNEKLWQRYLPQYKHVTNVTILRVLKRYGMDLTLFGYHFDTTSYIASCSTSDNQGHVFC